MHTRSPNKKVILFAAFALLSVIFLSFGIRWATYARPPLQEAALALESDSVVTVSFQPWLTFTPVAEEVSVGLIFYPGGRIDPQGYGSLLRSIAEAGYLVIIPKMPINMAAFNPNVAKIIIKEYPQIENWVIAGHSVGGTMAAQYGIKNPDRVAGVIIWASYPANSAELQNTSLPILTIYGSEDPRVNDESLAERNSSYPEQAEFLRIDGGDHHQFGSYQIEPDEHYATISVEEQHQQIVQATLEFITRISQN